MQLGIISLGQGTIGSVNNAEKNLLKAYPLYFSLETKMLEKNNNQQFL